MPSKSATNNEIRAGHTQIGTYKNDPQKPTDIMALALAMNKRIRETQKTVDYSWETWKKIRGPTPKTIERLINKHKKVPKKEPKKKNRGLKNKQKKNQMTHQHLCKILEGENNARALRHRHDRQRKWEAKQKRKEAQLNSTEI